MNTPLAQSVVPRPSGAWRAVLAAMALIIALSLLTACRNKEESAQPAAAEPTAQPAEAAAPTPQDAAPAAQLPQPTPAGQAEAVVAPAPAGSITLWHSWSQADGDALALILKDFQQRYPDITVETLFVAYDDLLQSYAQAVAAGSGPDLLLAPNWWLADLTTLGAVQPLDDRLPAEHLAALWPAAVDNLRVGGSLYGLPTTYELVALYYNKTLLPGGSLPASLDDLLAQAQQQPSAGIGLYANPFHVAWGFSAFGAGIFDAAGHAVLDQGDGAARFLTWLAAVNATEGSYVDSDYGMLLDRFKKGEFAFFVDGPWALPELAGVLGDSLGVAPLPPGPAGPAQPWLYADAVYVNPQASPAQQELALLLAEQLTGPAAGTILTQTAGRLPANRAAAIDGADPLLAGFAQQANTAQAMPHGPHMDAFWRYGGDMIFKALTGAQETQSIVVETAALINETTGQ